MTIGVHGRGLRNLSIEVGKLIPFSPNEKVTMSVTFLNLSLGGCVCGAAEFIVTVVVLLFPPTFTFGLFCPLLFWLTGGEAGGFCGGEVGEFCEGDEFCLLDGWSPEFWPLGCWLAAGGLAETVRLYHVCDMKRAAEMRSIVPEILWITSKRIGLVTATKITIPANTGSTNRSMNSGTLALCHIQMTNSIDSGVANPVVLVKRGTIGIKWTI